MINRNRLHVCGQSDGDENDPINNDVTRRPEVSSDAVSDY